MKIQGVLINRTNVANLCEHICGTGERTSFRQAKFAKDVIVAPVEHIITIYVDMYRVLAGKDSIGLFLRNVVLSVEQDMYAEAISALTTGLTAATNGTSYSYTGNFDMTALLQMAQRVEVYNSGVQPVIAGSAVALSKVIPDSAYGWRMNVDGRNPAIELVQSVYGYPVLKLNQAAAKNGGLVLPDNQIFVVSPAQDKLVKGAVSNALTNSNEFYQNADITQNYTMRRNYAFTYASAAKAGIYTIND